MAGTDDQGGALAVLIDADNASPSIIAGLMGEVARLGRATVRRIYGDWTRPDLKSWKTLLLEHSFQPVQQFAYTRGKNATDSALIIDAMDLLYSGTLDGFCIVSSDSDYTRLASRLRESGKGVYGFGEEKTPRPFVAACDRFIYTEVFSRTGSQQARPRAAGELDTDREFVALVGGAVDDASDESGWAHLGGVGSILTKKRPDFDPRRYGYSKLSDLLAASRHFEVRRQDKAVSVRRVGAPP